jgi:hypothetical protein
MKKLMLWAVALVGMFGTVACAQDVVGDWQGALNLGGGNLRMVMKVTKGDKGELSARSCTTRTGERHR